MLDRTTAVNKTPFPQRLYSRKEGKLVSSSPVYPRRQKQMGTVMRIGELALDGVVEATKL